MQAVKRQPNLSVAGAIIAGEFTLAGLLYGFCGCSALEESCRASVCVVIAGIGVSLVILGIAAIAMLFGAGVFWFRCTLSTFR
jgi:hypothetical protein